jgi:hypothetical protein
MNIQKGDQILVNLAPFIGSLRRNKEAIPCRVVAVDGPHIEVSTDYPYRKLSLRVERTWLEVSEGEEASSTLLV